MNPALFLLARLRWPVATESFGWLTGDAEPFEPLDPLDFVAGPEIQAVFEIYRAAYSGLDANLNVAMPEGLAEYNRWVLVEDSQGDVLAFVCFKTTAAGLKLGLLGTNGSDEGKLAVKLILRRGLSVNGVYGEVSNGVEAVLTGHVAIVSVSAAREILDRKPIEEDPDGRHYWREITNVGRKRKLMVGRPLLLE